MTTTVMYSSKLCGGRNKTMDLSALSKEELKAKSHKLAADAVQKGYLDSQEARDKFNERIRAKYGNKKLALVGGECPYIRGFLKLKGKTISFIKHKGTPQQARVTFNVKPQEKKVPEKKAPPEKKESAVVKALKDDLLVAPPQPQKKVYVPPLVVAPKVKHPTNKRARRVEFKYRNTASVALTKASKRNKVYDSLLRYAEKKCA